MQGEQLVKNYANTQEGEEIGEIISNQTGYLKSPELAYGEYVVIETSVPHEKEAITPIMIKITEDSRQPQNLRYITDPNFTAKIKIYTKDTKTGQTILKDKAKFVIKNKDTGELLTYKGWTLLEGNVEYGTYERPYETNQKGNVTTPRNLGLGNYEIIQLQAPEGYVLNGYEGYSNQGETIKTPQGNVTIQIATNQIYFVDNEREGNILVGIQENQAQVGSLKITNTGNYLKEIKNDEQGETNINYDIKGIEGASYQIIANDKIQSADGQTKLYDKGDIVTTVTTNKEGIGYAENLPQGTYKIKQTEIGTGFSLEDEQREINITYGSGKNGEEATKTPVRYYEENYKDKITQVEIELIDGKTKQKLTGINLELYRKNEQGQEELIEKFTTEKTNFYIERIKPGNYIIRQPKGQEKLYQNGYVTNQDIELKIEAKQNIQKIKIEQSKTKIEIEITDEGKVEGTIIQIKNKETGETVGEYKTNKDENIKIEQLPIGNYIIHYKEVAEEKGYVKGEDIELKIEDKTENQKTELKQDYTKLDVSLVDKDTKEAVKGGRLVITNKQGKEVTKEWITNGQKQRIEKIPVGEYYLVEKEAPTQNGYVKTEKIGFKIEATGKVQEITMLQDYTQIQINPKDEITGEEIKGIELIIKDEKGNIVGTITDETDDILTRLPVGTYTIESTKMPYGYKPIKQSFEIQDKQGIQGLDDLKIKIEREEFDLQVEVWIDQIKRNGKVEYENKKQEKTVRKIDIKDKNIKTEQIEIRYKIKISNASKIRGEVGKIEITIPQGMEYKQEDNKSYWKEEKGTITTTELKGKQIQERRIRRNRNQVKMEKRTRKLWNQANRSKNS